MKVQNKKGLGIVSKLFLLAAVLVLEAVLLGQTSITANAQGTAKVTADSGKIRKTPDTNSDVLASVKENDKLTVVAQTTASDGYTWYKVFVDDSTKGYIRADLVGDVEGSVETESASDAAANDSDNDATVSSNSSSNTTQEEEDDDEPVQQQVEFVQVSDSTVTKAKVTAGSVNVRSNPSTNASVAGKASEGTEVNVFGEATDGDGKIWYQVKYSSNDKTVEGFIRSDFLEVTESQEAAPVEEVPAEEVVEEPVEELTVPKEYEVVYEANPEGVEEWFLYDHNRGTKQSIADLLAVVRQTQEQENSAVSKLKTYKIFMIVMVAVILALIVGITLLIFKLKDAYEYEYEDDEDEDDEEDDEDEDEDDEEDDDEEDDDEMYVRAPRRSAPVTRTVRTSAPTSAKQSKPAARPVAQAPKKETSSSWQSKNFLDIDDDMEFEFLDIK